MSLNHNRHFPSSSSTCTNQTLRKAKIKNQNSNTKRSSSKQATKSSSFKAELFSEFFKKKPTEDEPSLDSCPETLCTKEMLHNSASDDDFKSPMRLRKRNNLVWNFSKAQPKKRRKNGKIIRNSTIEIIKENFDGIGENPEHLQMAIALSKSSYEADTNSKEETPDICQILQNVKPTNLERFGFKAVRPALSVEKRRLPIGTSEGSKRVRNRFKYITPILNIRSMEERESLIESKISLLMNRSNPPSKIKSEELLVSDKLQEVLCMDHQSIFQLDNIYGNNRFYTDSLGISQTYLKCGHLLKDWSSIAGRDKSPGRQACQESPPQSASPIGYQTVTNKYSKSLSPKGQIFSSVSSLSRSISPELFDSADEEWYESSDKSKTVTIEKLSESVDQNVDDLSSGDDVIVLSDDDIVPVNKISNKYSLKSADFYSLSEFEDAESVSSVAEKLDDNMKIINNDDINVSGNPKEFEAEGNNVNEYYDCLSSPKNVEEAEDDSVPHTDSYNHYLKHLTQNPDSFQRRLQSAQSPETFNESLPELILENFEASRENEFFSDMGTSSSEKHKIDYLFLIEDETVVSSLKRSERASANTPSASNQNNISCIELSDDSSSDHFEDLPSHSPVLAANLEETNSDSKTLAFEQEIASSIANSSVRTQMNDQDNNLTPDITVKNPHAYNSANLNVTDYIKNLLSQDNYSFDKDSTHDVKKLVCSDQEELLSSRGALDEELIDSSIRATPVSTFKTVNNLDLATEENANDVAKEDIFPKVPNNAIETTPVTKKFTIKTKNVTPMPDYGNMSTVLIQKELQKVGIKPLKRARGAKLLKYIYESTHPLLDSLEVADRSDTDDEGKVVKRRKKSEDGELQAPLVDIIGDRILENEKLEDLIFERRQSTKIPSCPIPLQVIWHNFLCCNPHIKEIILLYEPLQLETIHSMLKNLGFKFNMQDLLTFLDKKCITIKTAQKQRYE